MALRDNKRAARRLSVLAMTFLTAHMTAASNGSATNTTVVAALSHQAQYCGPYKIEKTLGKGQTGMFFDFCIY
uniref:Secreted protein n=1 Tax=Elaeophora elaphi TaxID=1147741 RepID=A0A0R3RUN4_9BILA